MAYTQEQINTLKKIQTQLKTHEAFQDYVTKNYGADKLQEIKTNLQQTMQQPASGVINQEKQINQTPTTPIQTPEQAKTQGVNVLTAEQLKAKNLGTTPTPTATTTTTPTPTPTPTPTETPKVEAPTEAPTEGPTEAPTEVKPTKIETIDQFKQAGGGVNNLEQFIENRYGTTADIVGNKVTAVVDGKKYEWTIDSAGNPIKTEVAQPTATTDIAQQKAQANIMQETEQEKTAKAMGIPYTKKADGSIEFKPQNLDDIYELYARYGKTFKADMNNVNAIKGGIIYGKIAGKVGLDANSLFNGMKNGEIAGDGATWDYLVKANGGQPTPEMLEAKKMYDAYLDKKIQTDLDNQMFDVMDGKSGAKDFYSSLISQNDKMISDFNKSMEDMMSKYNLIDENYQKGSEETQKLNEKSNNLATELEELYDERDNIIKDLKNKYVGMSYGTIMRLAQKETEAIDERIKAKDREYRNAFNNFTFAKDNDLKTYEIQVRNMDRQVTFMNQAFQLSQQRFQFASGLAMNEFNYNRAKQDAADKMQQEYEQAIKLKDYDAALQLKLAQEKFKLDSSQFIHDQKTGMLVKVDDAGNIIAQIDFNKLAGGAQEGSFLDNLFKTGAGGSIGDYYSQFRITQNVGDKSPNSKDTGWNGGTPGIDFAMPVGTEVKATVGGKVISAQSNKDYGTNVIIEDANGNKHRYSHLSKPNVSIGDTIQPGQTIALSGNTGFSTGPHLDYRVTDNAGKPIDPNQFLGGKTQGQSDYSVILQKSIDNGILNYQDVYDIATLNLKDIQNSNAWLNLGEDKNAYNVTKDIIDKAIEENSQKYGYKNADAFVTTFGGSLSKLSDEDRAFINGNLKAGMALGDNNAIIQFVKNSVINNGKDNGISNVSSQIATMEEIGKRIGVINTAMNKLGNKDKDYVITNLLAGNVAKAQQKLGMGTELAELDSLIGFLSDKYRVAITGAAATEREIGAILRKFPSITNSNELNQKLFGIYKGYLATSELSTLDKQLKNFGLTIYDIDTQLGAMYDGAYKGSKSGNFKDLYMNRNNNPDLISNY